MMPRSQPGPEGDAEHAVRERHPGQLCQLDGIRRANHAGQPAPHLGLATALLHGPALGQIKEPYDFVNKVDVQRNWGTRWIVVLFTCIDRSRPKWGSRHFLNIFQMSLRRKIFLLFLPDNANPTPLDHVIRLYLIYIFLLILVKAASRPFFPLAVKRFRFYVPFLIIYPVLHCLVLIKLTH